MLRTRQPLNSGLTTQPVRREGFPASLNDLRDHGDLYVTVVAAVLHGAPHGGGRDAGSIGGLFGEWRWWRYGFSGGVPDGNGDIYQRYSAPIA